MSSKYRQIGMSFAFIAAAYSAFTASSALAACATPTSTATDVTKTVIAMYAAAQKDDLESFHTVTTQDFYAFENGKRFDGDELMHLVTTAHAKGTKFEWSVTQPTVEADCTMALITYVNVGSVTTNGVPQPLRWLESAVLRYDGARWRIRFFSSTREPQSQPAAK